MRKLGRIISLSAVVGFATPALTSFAADTRQAAVETRRATEDYSTDLDADGIPDVIEDYYDSHIRDQYMFGIGLGALISSSISLLGVAYQAVKFKKLSRMTMAISEGSHATLISQERLFSDMKEEYSRYVAEAQEKLEGMARENEELRKSIASAVASLKESSKTLSYYANFDGKLNAILSNQRVMADTPEYTTLGVSSKVQATVKAVEGAK